MHKIKNTPKHSGSGKV